LKFLFFLFKHTNNINCFGIFSFLEYSKLKIGIFYSAEYFFAFSHLFKYQKFFAAKTLTQMSHLFSIAGLGPIVFFYRWITWPGVFSTTGFCFIILQRRSRSVHSWNGIIFAYDALVVVLLLLGQSCLLLFSSFFFISLVYYLKCPAITLSILLHCSGL